MKNYSFFTIALIALMATAWIATRGPHAGSVEGEFAEYIRADGQWAYLVGNDGQTYKLDSCRVLGRKFLLTGSTPRKGRTCHIEFSRFDIRPEVHLEPKTTLRLRITAETEPSIRYLNEESTDDMPACETADSLKTDSLQQRNPEDKGRVRVYRGE